MLNTCTVSDSVPAVTLKSQGLKKERESISIIWDLSVMEAPILL